MLEVEIDQSNLRKLQHEFGASEKQMILAFNGAARKTIRKCVTVAKREAHSTVGTRTQSIIAKRIKPRIKRGKDGTLFCSIWFGFNDLPPEAFKGKIVQSAQGVIVKEMVFDSAFVAAMSSGKVSAFRRKGAGRLPIEKITVPIIDEFEPIMKNDVWKRWPEIFMAHYERELRARAVYGVGAR